VSHCRKQENTGKDTAKKVQVDVTNIFEDGKTRNNFLPMPLRWTHIDREIRDILPGQTVYLDVFDHHTSKHSVNLATRFGGGVKDFRELNKGQTKLELTFYEQSGRSFITNVEISWGGTLFLDARVQNKPWVLTKNGSFLNQK